MPKKPCILTEPDCIEKVYAYQFMVGRLTIEVESEDYTNNDQIRVAFYGANPKRTLEDLVTQSEVFGEQVLTIIESYLNV